MKYPEFEQYAKNIVTWGEQWDIICSELRKYGEKTPEFETVLVETKSSFGKVIQSGIFDNLNMILIQPESIRQLWRFVKESDIKKLTPERFVPMPEYASLNRMNDTDRLYSYFSICYRDSAGADVVKTGVREIQAKTKDDVWKCQFELVDESKSLKIVDFSPECKIPKEEEAYSKFLFSKVKDKFPEHKGEVEYWLTQTLLQIFHESNMFSPVDKNQKQELQRIKYKPFHVICDYLERQGVHGIIYRSTVFKKGRCLALFNPAHASCEIETLEKVDVARAIK